MRDYKQESTAAIIRHMEFYLARGRNAYIYGVDSIKADADFVIDGSMPLDNIVDIITKKLQATKKS